MRDLLQQVNVCWYIALLGLPSGYAFTCKFTSSQRINTRLLPTENNQWLQGIQLKTILFQTNNPGDGPLDDFGLNEPFTEDRVKEIGDALEQRLGDVAKMQQALEQRLQDLTIKTEKIVNVDKVWQSATPTTVQGSSLRTWAFSNPNIKRLFVLLKTDGRPLDADVELWQGPDNTPHKMKVYVEDGAQRTFSTFIDTPRGPNAICVKNTGHLEFPLYALVGPDEEFGESCLQAVRRGKAEIIQGGALRTYAFEPIVDSVAVSIKTDGRPLSARIELLQGPNNNKQVMELYTEDGLDRPFLTIVQTPGFGNVVRVVNTAPVEFPMQATVTEHEISTGDAYDSDGIQIGRDL